MSIGCSFRSVPSVELLCKWEPGQRGVWCATSNVCLYEYHNKIISKFNVAGRHLRLLLLTDHPAVCHSTFLCLLPGVSVYIGAAAVAFMRLHLSNCQMSCPQQDIAGKVVGLGMDDVRSCVTRFACQAGLCRCSTRINQKHVVAAFCAIRKWITWNEWMSVLWLRHNNKNNITKTVPVPDPVPGNSLQCGLDDKNGCLLI